MKTWLTLGRGDKTRRFIGVALVLFLGTMRAAVAADTVTLSQAQLGNVFATGETVQIPVATTGTSVSWTATDFFGAVTSGGPVTVNAQGQATILPNLGRLGYFALHVTAARAGNVVASADTTFAVLAPTSLQTRSDSPFGVCTHFAQGWNTDVMALITRAGIAQIRDEQYWPNIEPTLTSPPTYVFPASYQAYMDTAAALGLTPSVELDFENGNYDGGNTPYTAAGDAGYAGYGAALVSHYGAELRSVQVWNEYNGSYCQGPATANRPTYYTAMLKAAYQAIKLASPQTTVVGGACVPLPLPWFQSLFDAGALDYMDAADIHPYVDPPEGLEVNLASLQSLMAQYNHGNGPKPIWATECGYVDAVNPGRQLMASYLVRLLTLMRTAGVARAYWYALYDVPDSLSGLLRAPTDPLGRYAPTSGYPAYANLIQQLYGTTFVQRENTDARTRFYSFNRATDGQQVRVLWSTSGTAQIVLGASAPLTVINLMGEAVSVAPNNGLVAVSTDLNPVFVVGPVTSVLEVGRDQLLADSIRDFSATQGSGPGSWVYGYYDGDITAYGAGYNSGSFKQMTYTLGSNEYEWTGPYYSLLIDQNGAHPSSRPVDPNQSSGAYTQVWSVRRWQSNVAGTAHITGTVDRASTMGDGTTATVFVDGVQVFSQLVTSNGSAQVDVSAQVQAGSDIDFVVTAGPGTDLNYDYVSFPAQIAVAAAAPTTFAAWQGEYFTAAQIVDPTVSGDAANPAHDGLPNLLKYALGLNPLQAAISPVQTDTTTGYLRMVVPKNSSATDLTYTVQATSNLSDPNSWSTSGLIIEANTSSVLQVRDDVPVQGGGTTFAGLPVMGSRVRLFTQGIALAA